MRGFPFFFSTRFLVLFTLTTIVLVPLYFAYPSSFALPLALDGILLLAAAFDFFIAPPPNRIGIERPLPYPLAVDRPNEIPLEIVNRTGRQVVVLIEDDVPVPSRADSLPLKAALGPGVRATVTYSLIPLERGDGEFGTIHFWVQGPLGLVWRRGEAPAAATVKLYPGLALIQDRKLSLWRPAVEDAVRARWKRGVGTEFDSLREYVPGDDFRLVHWRTSARKGRPVVRQNRMERDQIVFLVIDAGRMMTARVLGKTKFDLALNASLLIAYSALELGDKVGMMVVGQDIVSFMPPARRPGQFGRVLDSVYTLKPRMEEPRFFLALSNLATRLKRRSLVIIFTDLIDERASEGLTRCSLGLTSRHLPLVVAMSDTEVVQLADSTPRTRQDLYGQGVACGILDRRERLMAGLASRGVMILDTRPDRISMDALDRYLEIKTRNLL